MTEQEMLKKIKESADEIEIPESIRPENMKKRMDAQQTAENQAAVHRSVWKRGGTAAHRSMWKRVGAAAAVLVVGLGGAAAVSHEGASVWQTAQDDGDGNGGNEAAEDRADSRAGNGTAENNAGSGADGGDGNGGNGTAENSADGKDAAEPKKDAGALYVVAENYGEVYDVLYKYYGESGVPAIYNATDDSIDTGGETRDEATVVYEAPAAGSAMAESVMSDAGGIQDLQSQSMKQNAGEHDSGVRKEAQREEESYSRTNVQTAGVDESDIVKTDGSYIYVVHDDAVEIIDVRGKAMRAAGEIEISMDSATDQVLEMYVDGDVLNLIVQKENTDLKESDGTEGQETKKRAYYMETSVETELFTYDIKNRRNPVLSGSITQDGYYKTSRKLGNIVYLFTQEWMNLPELTREEAALGKDADGWIPLVNGEAVAADCIYVPEYGETGLIISSTDIDKPDEVVDNTMIINDYVDIYVSSGALYLYGTEYGLNTGVRTQIAKFSLKGGKIQAVGATLAAGEVRDTFAINEYYGTLRLLTTDWSNGENENRLYLFDEDLKLTGELNGIAKGEQIYAARYFGDTVYFVTYRNTDPLFAVDLSDEEHPKILSELEITGFSEYLHFWGEDKLVGIGYETDPDNGAQEGIKLTMFDISDPSELKTLGTCVLDDLDYSPALYDYKCVLADEEENILGFAGESYDYNGKGADMESYLLFAWEDGEFKNLLTEKLDADEEKTDAASNVSEGNSASDTEDLTVETAVTDVLYTGEDIGDYRGLYVGGRFYIVSPSRIISYDRENGYRMVQKLKLRQ